MTRYEATKDVEIVVVISDEEQDNVDEGGDEGRGGCDDPDATQTNDQGKATDAGGNPGVEASDVDSEPKAKPQPLPKPKLPRPKPKRSGNGRLSKNEISLPANP